MVKKILLAVIGVILALITYASMQPNEYTISRDVMINAPAEKIFPYLNNSKRAEMWGPWREEDPDAKMVYSGPDDGIGSKASWSGGKKLGTGSATIVESIPNQRVGIQLEYQEPMNMQQYAEYLLEISGSQTKVTWRVRGTNSLPNRIMCLFVNMDKIVGTMFEKGLTKLKDLVEKAP